MKKCVIYMAIGAFLALTYKMYEEQIMSICNKMVKVNKKVIKEGLEKD